VRDFWRSQDGQLSQLATRVSGSPDLYGWSRRRPAASINLITSHDGFTLRDLVSYDTKHNQANGEANRDGTDDNRSWNCGVEGRSDDPAILVLRARQSRALLATLMLSRGVPMLGGGDELGRTQGGNNNAFARTTRSPGTTGRPSTTTCSPSPTGCSPCATRIRCCAAATSRPREIWAGTPRPARP
jgi:isoamylase